MAKEQFSRTKACATKTLYAVQAVHHGGCLEDCSRQLWRPDRPLYAMSQNSPTLLPSRETGASPSCLKEPKYVADDGQLTLNFI